jgi:hypothetical protein
LPVEVVVAWSSSFGYLLPLTVSLLVTINQLQQNPSTYWRNEPNKLNELNELK